MKKTAFYCVCAALLLSCQGEKKSQVSYDDLIVTVRMAPVGGQVPTWAEGDFVYFSDDASSRPGFQFKASSSDISPDGKILSATYKSADPGAATLYAIHAATGRIRMKKTEAISVIYDGTLASAALPAGTAAKGSEITLSPIVGAGEFSLERGYVTKVRIASDKKVFPSSLSYDFAAGEVVDLKSSDLIEVALTGNGPFYLPLVPGGETVRFDIDFLNDSGQTVASASGTRELVAAAGTLTSLGKLDEDATDILDPTVEEFEKASEAIAKMGVGLNLSGSFEVLWKDSAAQADRNNPTFYERQNGCGPTTQETMDSFASAGFGCVRIPITWWMHMDDVFTANTIDKVWLDRIEEVVGYCQKANLYCIINMHHDAHAHEAQGGQWLYADQAHYEKISAAFQKIWRQIAVRFKDYDEKVIFEGYNEITDVSGAWNFPKSADDIMAANKLNQDFVNTVRKTGGNNATRNLVVSSYTCSVSDRALQAFVMPSDLYPGHLIWQVHNYAPSSFCGFNPSNPKDTFGDPEDYADIQSALSTIQRLILDKGWPCIIGEYGAPQERQAKEQQPDGSWRIKKSEDERAEHAYYYTKEALSLGVTPIFWYNLQEGNRRSLGTWSYPKVKDALIRAKNESVTQ